LLVTTAPRPYHSTLRGDQSQLTRRRIVDAGAELFVERGFVPTTVDAIAERAGVSRRTVFTSVGSKADVLKLAFDWTLAGDDEPVPLADRPAPQHALQADDPFEVVTRWIAVVATINERVAALYRVVVVAADAEPDVAALLALSDSQRREGMRRIVDRVLEVGELRPGLTGDEAAAILDVLIDPMNYRRFVDNHGWSTATYVRHLQHVATSILR
jgi:AcrR family transcriptional regulator